MRNLEPRSILPASHLGEQVIDQFCMEEGVAEEKGVAQEERHGWILEAVFFIPSGQQEATE